MNAEHTDDDQREALIGIAQTIAREVSNLLTAIVGYADVALGQLTPNQPLYADIREIRRAGESAASLTRQLLAFSRTESTGDIPVTPSPPLASLSGTATILLVEEQQEVRVVVRDALARAGYVVLESVDGAEALAATRRYRRDIDLLITDLVMPRMGGRDLAENFVREQPGARVLFMSGSPADPGVPQGILEGSVAFIQKPFTPIALLQKTRDILGAEAPRR